MNAELDAFKLAAADAVEAIGNVLGSLRCAAEWANEDGAPDIEAARREYAGCLIEGADFATEACEKLRALGLKMTEAGEKGGAL